MSAKAMCKNVKVEKRNNRQSKRKQKQGGVQRLRSSRGGIQFQGALGGGSRVDWGIDCRMLLRFVIVVHLGLYIEQ